MYATPVRAQPVELSARVGVAFSSPLVEDRIGTAPARQLFGGAVDSLVRVVPAPGPSAGVVARVGFWPRAAVELAIDWTHTRLEAEENGGTRELQTLDVVQGTVGASWTVREFLQLGAAVGMLRYMTEERGIFAGGSDVSPLAEARLALTPPLLARRAALVVHVQTHRFGTPSIRDRGGLDGSVTRLDAGVRIRLAELGR